MAEPNLFGGRLMRPRNHILDWDYIWSPNGMWAFWGDVCWPIVGYRHMSSLHTVPMPWLVNLPD